MIEEALQVEKNSSRSQALRDEKEMLAATAMHRAALKVADAVSQHMDAPQGREIVNHINSILPSSATAMTVCASVMASILLDVPKEEQPVYLAALTIMTLNAVRGMVALVDAAPTGAA